MSEMVMRRFIVTRSIHETSFNEAQAVLLSEYQGIDWKPCGCGQDVCAWHAYLTEPQAIDAGLKWGDGYEMKVGDDHSLR